MEIFGGLLAIFFGLFFLASPFLIISLFKQLKETRQRLDTLSHSVEELSQTLTALPQAPSPTEAPEETAQAEPVAQPAEQAPSPETTTALAKTAEPEATVTLPPAAEVGEPEITPPEPPETGPETPTPPTSTPYQPEEIEVRWQRKTPSFDLGEKIKAWLLGGNTVARVGVVVLFFGVAFFLKYAVDRGWLPIEVRLMAAALGGLVLIALGWRLRVKRQNYALVLQGGGIGIVYLIVFAAVSLYELVPATPGLVLMVVLVVLSSALAVLQDARSLAVLAAVGGFLAPVLISRGGNHITLFSYYAILDAGILAIAWFKAWRELNLIGFVFTFVIGTM